MDDTCPKNRRLVGSILASGLPAPTADYEKPIMALELLVDFPNREGSLHPPNLDALPNLPNLPNLENSPNQEDPPNQDPSNLKTLPNLPMDIWPKISDDLVFNKQSGSNIIVDHFDYGYRAFL